ncbi:hypothetical protein [Flavobacterium bizetiae]
MNNVYNVRILIVGLTTVLSLTSYNNANFKNGFATVINRNSNN